ncbi:MAG TPA: patatin-like phospholipase family protein [Stellaceae bacterium]|nr:patatin-like phospholipase family protein [Stellaceae bacterium]
MIGRSATGRLAALSVLTTVALVGGCASLTVEDTVALKPDQLNPPGSERISKGGYRLASLSSVAEGAPDMLILVGMSGGGKRSAAFAYGALKGMREFSVPTPSGARPLLGEVDAISGVSGGSFPAAYYGLYREAAFGKFETDFLYDDTESYIFGIYLLPWNWTWLADPTVGTNDFMERVYDRTMFHGATFADLQKRGRPLIAIDATDLSYGTPFLFTQENFDLICSDLEVFPVARAVAASNGFPGLFSPVTLTNRAAQCGGRKPGWLLRVTPGQRADPLSRIGVQSIFAERYLDEKQTTYVHLVDGGVSDNLALRASGTAMEEVSQSTSAIAGSRLLNIRRILVISIDGQGAQDSSVARRQAVGGIMSLFGLVSGAQIDRYNFETLTTVVEQINRLTVALKKARCGTAPAIDGIACDDVKGTLVHISLSGMEPGPEKDKLLAIPTGLTIQREDVDLLVSAGHDAVLSSAALRQFIADYPPHRVAPARTAQAAPPR